MKDGTNPKSLIKQINRRLKEAPRIRGISAERLQELCSSQFENAHDYELIFICNWLDLYHYEFEEEFGFQIIQSHGEPNYGKNI